MSIPVVPCVFCQILSGEMPATFVFRDERCSAFMDIQPVNPGHMLVVPNRHAAHLAELDGVVAGHVMQIGQMLAAALRRSGLRCEGVNLFLADGEAAMQQVLHVHLHVLPRFAGDGFGLRFAPDYARRPPREELERDGSQLREAIGRHAPADR